MLIDNDLRLFLRTAQYKHFDKIEKGRIICIKVINKATHDGKHRASGGVVRSKKMLMAYWDKLIDGIDGKIAKLENELKTITNDIERIERNAKIIALMELKIDLRNGEFGEYENGD